MNFEESVKMILDEIKSKNERIFYYSLEGDICLFVNNKYKVWKKIFLRGNVRKNSTYLFDIFITIEYIAGGFFRLKIEKSIKKNYFNLNSTQNIPVKGKDGKYALLDFRITHQENILAF